MSWTTSSPYPRRPFSRIISPEATPTPTPTTASTEPATSSSPPPLVGSPKPVPRSLTLSSGGSTKSRTPISPHKLAKLANALGVATPAPASVPYPLYSPATSNASSSLATSSSTPSRYLIHVIPPVHLLLAPQEDPADPYERQQFRRGTLVSLHPTLNSQLGAIAREYSLPSIGGIVLYLISDNEAGPRITDDAWRMLWYRALQVDKDGSSNGKTIARFHSRSVTYSNNNSPYPSPSTTSESPHRSASPSNGNASPSSMSLDLPINVHPGSALPILAKVEFDIDRRKAPWYERWKHRGRATSHSMVNSPQLLGGFNGSGSRKELQLPLRARSTSPSLAEFKAKYTGTSASTSSAQISLNSPDESERDGYMQLEDDIQPKRRRKRKMIHNGEFTDDPLDDVFPNDKATWAQIRGEHGQDEATSPTSPHTPDVMIGGRIGDAIMRMDGDVESGDESVDDDAEDVLTMWKEKHKRTLDSLSTPGSPNSRPSTASRSRSASKHVPPPLDLSNSSKSQIPHVEIAPPTATSPRMSVNSDLPYLGKNARGMGGAGSQEDMTAINANGIQIVVEGTSTSTSEEGGQLSAGLPRRGSTSTVGSEEDRSRRLDELERRIENLSPRSAWEDENGDDESHQIVDSPESTSPKMTPTISFDQGSEHDHNAQAEDSSLPTETSASLTVKSTKASRRQVSMGSFNSIPGASDLAQALAIAAPSPPLESPPLPPIPTEQGNDNEEQSALAPPIDLASATPTPTTPGFPMSPDPFHRDNIFGRAMKVEIPPSAFNDVTKNGSPVSPPIRVSSRFSADSVTSDDGAKSNSNSIRTERTGSIMSVKGIRSLWRKSGNSKGQPLMSPGPNGVQHMFPPTPPPFSDAPPLPMSAGGFLSVSPRTPSQSSFQLPPSPNPSSTSFDISTPTSARASSSTPPPPPPSHGRSDSGLDPFHFDQESRYPVHKTPSPSQAFTDVVPPPALPESLATTPPATSAAATAASASAANAQKKGILKGWGSKGSLKRTSAEVAQQGSHPPSSFGSGKKARRPSASGSTPGHNGHSKSSSKASISSVGTNSKHSGSGTSHGSHGQGSISPAPSVPSDPRPSLSTPSPLPGSSGRSSPAMSINVGHKSTGSNGSALTTTGSEGRRSTERKSTPPPPGALERAAAVAASREKRGTSYIGPADNRI